MQDTVITGFRPISVPLPNRDRFHEDQYLQHQKQNGAEDRSPLTSGWTFQHHDDKTRFVLSATQKGPPRIKGDRS